MKEIKPEVKGWLLVFLLTLALATLLLFLALGMLLREGRVALGLSRAGLASAAIALAGIANVVAIAALTRKKGSGVPLAQRALIMTFLATLHLSILYSIVGVPFLKVLLAATGVTLAWLLYFGINTKIRKSYFSVDFSRRVAITYPAKKRRLKWGVKALYSLLIVSYALYILGLLWVVAGG